MFHQGTVCSTYNGPIYEEQNRVSFEENKRYTYFDMQTKEKNRIYTKKIFSI